MLLFINLFIRQLSKFLVNSANESIDNWIIKFYLYRLFEWIFSLLFKSESIKIYWLSVKIWLIQIAKKRLLLISQISLINSVNINWFNSEIYFSNWFDQWKLTNITVKNIFSLVNHWKGKSLISSVKIWLIHI